MVVLNSFGSSIPASSLSPTAPWKTELLIDIKSQIEVGNPGITKLILFSYRIYYRLKFAKENIYTKKFLTGWQWDHFFIRASYKTRV